MHKHILIATDGSKLADKGVDTGLKLARTLGAKVTIITVSEPRTHLVPATGMIELASAEDEEARHILDMVSAAASKLEVPCATVHIKNEYPAEAILQEADKKHCDLIIMASHGRRGVARMLLGGETIRVVTHARVPVLVCK